MAEAEVLSDYKSIKVFLFDGSYILKSAITNHSERFARGTEGELIITLPKDVGGLYERKYLSLMKSFQRTCFRHTVRQ